MRTLKIKKKKSSGRSDKSAVLVRKVFILVIFLLAQALFYYSDFFKLKTIKIYGNNRVSETEIVSAAGIPLDHNVVTLPLAKFRKNLDKIYWIKDVKIKWNLPGRVDIFVEERTPFLIVKQMSEAELIKFAGREFEPGSVEAIAAPDSGASPVPGLSPSPGASAVPQPLASPAAVLTGSPQPSPSVSPSPSPSSTGEPGTEEQAADSEALGIAGSVGPYYAADEYGVVLYKAEKEEYPRFSRLIIDEKPEIGKKISADRVKTIKELENWISADLKKEVVFYSVDERLQAVVYVLKNKRILKIKIGKIENMNHKMEVLAAISELVNQNKKEVEYIDLRFKEPVIKLVEKPGEEPTKPTEGGNTHA
ncbi:MAG: FtsQ-type POTRA domain-containing protein [Firmicutes bacterium]|nr:FtsQ-type POTRA domain-containing protein [Bacillota bacterium]